MKTDRVILDTNIFVSLILNKQLDELVVWYKEYNTAIFVCAELIDELTDVLKREKIKKKLTEPVVAYIRFIRLVTQPVDIEQRFDRAPDIKDNYLF